MKKREGSIATRFVFIVLLILAVGQGVLWMWFIFGQKEHNRAMMKNKVQASVNLLVDISEKALLDGGFTALDPYVESVLRDEDMLSVRFLDKDGSVIKVSSARKEAEARSINPLYIPWTNTLKVPIGLGEAKSGFVEVSYSGRRVNDEMKRLLTIPVLGQALVFLFVVYGIYFFFQRKVGRPIKLLNSGIKRATGGDLTVDMGIGLKDEIGSIATGLKFLVDKLSSTISKLNSTADNVAMAIKQLEVTFNNAGKSVSRQSKAMDEMAVSLRDANDSQKKITESAERLSGFSAENVTSLIEMRASADEIVSNTGALFRSVDDSHSTVSEMSQSSKAIAENASEVLSSVEDTFASIEEISASVREIEANARESTALAENVRTIAAEKGVLTVVDAIEGMDRISDKVKYSVEVVTRLGARSKDIEKMLSVIKEVTEKTNLLSLNAAILAVQAGEYGKGFSVVADEIRALSDRTAVSTKEIAGIVSTIHKEIGEVVDSIESGMVLVEEGSTLVYNAGESIAKVVEEAQKSAGMATSIQRATEEQVKGLRQIASSVENIRSMISRAAKATEEQVKGSDYMLERLVEVKDVTESNKRGIEEQATGIKLISRNIELATDGINEINKAAVEQQAVNDGIITAIEQMKSTGQATLNDMEEVTLSLKTLQEEMQVLRKEMEAFKVK